MTTPRCEGADLSVCAPSPTEYGLDVMCHTHNPLDTVCVCLDVDDCDCALWAGRIGARLVGSLYLGRGVCRDVVTP